MAVFKSGGHGRRIAMTRRLHAGPAALCLAALIGGSAPARAQAAFDGAWSVLIVTESGACDRAYRYAVKISKGAVSYAGEAGINLSGRVSGNGSVKVTVSGGSQSATGTGRMTGSSGVGKWTGRSGNQQCAGTWEAERREQNARG
jgi:hypothetical protein